MSASCRDKLLQAARESGLDVTCSKAFTVRAANGPDIDFFPPKADWHDGVEVDAPRQPRMDEGRRNAIKMLKRLRAKKMDHPHWAEIRSFELKELVLLVQREKNFSQNTDPTGQKRFSEAQRRISEGTWRN